MLSGLFPLPTAGVLAHRLPGQHGRAGPGGIGAGELVPNGMSVGELVPILASSGTQENWPYPSLAAALRRIGPAPCLCNTVELALAVWP